MNFTDFAAMCAARRLTAVDHGNGHWQIHGGVVLVNYYPLRGTIFVNGTSRAVERGEASAAISVALNGPAAVRLERRRANGYASDRRWLFRKAQACWWCKCRLNFGESTIDHVVPLSRGGTNRRDNLVLACKPCNAKRANKCGAPTP